MQVDGCLCDKLGMSAVRERVEVACEGWHRIAFVVFVLDVLHVWRVGIFYVLAGARPCLQGFWWPQVPPPPGPLNENPRSRLTRWDVRSTLAPLSHRYLRVGMAARMRVSSVMVEPSRGTCSSFRLRD
jgi:hypothetical protein